MLFKISIRQLSKLFTNSCTYKQKRPIQKDSTCFFFIFYYELLFNIQMFKSDQTKDFSDVLTQRQCNYFVRDLWITFVCFRILTTIFIWTEIFIFKCIPAESRNRYKFIKKIFTIRYNISITQKLNILLLQQVKKIT